MFRVPVETLALRGTPKEQVVPLAEHYDMVIVKALDEEVVGLQKAAPYLQATRPATPTKSWWTTSSLKGAIR